MTLLKLKLKTKKKSEQERITCIVALPQKPNPFKNTLIAKKYEKKQRQYTASTNADGICENKTQKKMVYFFQAAKADCKLLPTIGTGSSRNGQQKISITINQKPNQTICNAA